MRSNCLAYALGKWWREGGYILIRRSYLAREFGIDNPWHPAMWVPHFLHRSRDHVVTQFAPTEVQKELDQHRGVFLTWINLWRFDGQIAGDDQPMEIDRADH